MGLSKKKKLNISLRNSNNEVLKKYAEVWRGIKGCIAKINDNKSKEFNSVKYGKYYMKIKFNSDYNLNTKISYTHNHY